VIDSSRCAVVIPCFNEARTIRSLVSAVRRHIDTVIVVDDGSRDATAEEAESAGATVVRLAHNSGKGTALQSGLRRADDLGKTFAVTMDGDGQHSPEDLPGFLHVSGPDEVDLVIGNRMQSNRAMPWLRRFVNRWMSRRISRLAGQELPDSQCGYRLIRIATWKSLDLVTSGFEIESEMLLAFVRHRATIRFVPIQTIYKSEQSKIHPIRDTVRWFRWWREAKGKG
jgi:glycosyltransferase involved in cell wall biosynthesis